MNPRLQDLFSRRSIRKYSQDKVEPEKIQDLLEAAMAAPSAVAKDPWRFIFVEEASLRKDMTSYLPNGQMLADAPLAVLVCGDLSAAHRQDTSYLLQDCSAAIENLLLAASMLGLGAVWLGVHPVPDRVKGMRSLFALPENIIPVSAIAIGYPAEKKEPRTRMNSAYIHRNHW